jgi:prepilin-type processing-associated H-X9-DG protein/prepilin-type N-terminal cleavage/methylation domain-containing protein
MRSHLRCHAYTLIELLIVVGIIALLLSLLVPAMARAKAHGKEVVCASNLHQLGIAMASYTVEARQWIPGSPNTTGWGSFAHGSPAEPDAYESNGDQLPDEKRRQTHVYDWVSPLNKLMRRQAEKLTDRQIEGRKDVFQCPALPQGEAYSEFTHSYQELPSYLTSIYFLVSIPGGGTYKAFGYEAKNKFDYLQQYKPRIELIGPPGRKVYLADGTRLSQAGAAPRYEHATNGYADYGAWRNRGDSVLQAYRDPNLVPMSYRHLGSLNALFFDGHVADLSEPESRKPGYWFPSGTNTAKLPNKTKQEEALIVP